jgi:hypothetical protein
MSEGGEGGDEGPPPYVAPPPYAPPPAAGSPNYGLPGYWPQQYPPAAGYGSPYPAPPGYPHVAYPPPPGYGAAPGGYYRPPQPPPPLAFGTVPAGLAGLGALLVVVSLLGLPWFALEGQSLTTGDIRGLLDDYGDLASGLAVAYFSWLSWLLLVVAAGSAVAAALPNAGLSLAFRIAGPITSGFAVLLTVGAIELKNSIYASDDDYSRYFDSVSAGFWTALIGFVLIGAAGIIGPRKLRAPAQ